jgi:hypothetical protein
LLPKQLHPLAADFSRQRQDRVILEANFTADNSDRMIELASLVKSRAVSRRHEDSPRVSRLKRWVILFRTDKGRYCPLVK